MREGTLQLFSWLFHPAHLVRENDTDKFKASQLPFVKVSKPACLNLSGGAGEHTWEVASQNQAGVQGGLGFAACMANTASQASILGVHYTTPAQEGTVS